MPEASLPMAPSFQDIAERGEKIYAERYRADLEERARGKFVAIHVGRGGDAWRNRGSGAPAGAREGSGRIFPFDPCGAPGGV